MKALAIIPGKQKSKRCPNKNTRWFLGREIVDWTLEAALESRCFDRVILYSDIEEWDEYDRLKNVWPLYNDMAEDKYTVAQVCEHILMEELKDEGSYDAFCCLLPTAPMRNAEDIKGAYGLLQKDVACEGVMGVTEFIQPWWQALVKSGEHWYPDYPDIFDY